MARFLRFLDKRGRHAVSERKQNYLLRGFQFIGRLAPEFPKLLDQTLDDIGILYRTGSTLGQHGGRQHDGDDQPRLTAVTSKMDGDLHFLCDGRVTSTESHAELHMHGVHFKKTGNTMVIWMDMHKDGEVTFETRYTLVRSGD